MIRIAFALIGGGRGTGGYNYLLNLVRVLKEHQSSAITPVLTVGTDVPEHEIEPFTAIPGLEVVRAPALDVARKRQALARSLVFGRDSAHHDLLRDLRIDVVFESAQFFGWRLELPVIGWITDFQHRILPHMFTRKGYWRREIGFQAQLASGRTVMLSSEDARRHCERFYPSTVGRTRAVRFAVPPTQAPDLASARAVADSYGLPDYFLFMPNQLSKHKNHLLVLDALAILRRRGGRVVVVSSGKLEDERHPEHFPAVERRVKELVLGEEFRLLGMIPYPHVRALMRASVSLLNPSLFEGWSTPVEEARSLGVPLVLSDLAVHKEQAGNDARYFDRHSPESLAQQLAQVQPLSEAEKDRRLANARESATDRVRTYAAEFTDLARRVVAGDDPG
jgi:glycosyltransferase involved in cell wall biosynthesis